MGLLHSLWQPLFLLLLLLASALAADPYKTLGLHKSASAKDIKAAYRRARELGGVNQAAPHSRL